MSDHGSRESAGQAITARSDAQPITTPITTVHDSGEHAGQTIMASDHGRSRAACARAITPSPPFSTGGEASPGGETQRASESVTRSRDLTPPTSARRRGPGGGLESLKATAAKTPTVEWVEPDTLVLYGPDGQVITEVSPGDRGRGGSNLCGLAALRPRSQGLCVFGIDGGV